MVRHDTLVRKIVPSNQLLVLDAADPDGFGMLSEFLGHTNFTKERPAPLPRINANKEDEVKYRVGLVVLTDFIMVIVAAVLYGLFGLYAVAVQVAVLAVLYQLYLF